MTLSHDPLGRLIRQTSGGVTTRFLYAGGMISAELDGANAWLRRYVPGPGMDEPIVWYEGAGTSDRRFLQADERGSIVAISNGAGATIAINSYDEYGNPAATNLGRFQYTGQAWLPESGLYYYKARIYSPSLGRFMQTDPIGYADGMNIYAYVGNDPVNKTDPWGLKKKTPPKPTPAPDVTVTGTIARIRVGEIVSIRNISQAIDPTTLEAGNEGEEVEVVVTASFPQEDQPAPDAPQNVKKICDAPLKDGRTIRQNVAEVKALYKEFLKYPPGSANLQIITYFGANVFPKQKWGGRIGEPWGNYNYGAAGRAAGLSLEVLQRIAGFVEANEDFFGRTSSHGLGQGSPLGGPPYGDTVLGSQQIAEGYNAACN